VLDPSSGPDARNIVGVAADAPPWDPPPLTTARKIRLKLSVLALFFAAILLASIFLLIIFLMLAEGTGDASFGWEAMALLAAGALLTAVVLFFTLRAFRAIRWRLRLSRIETEGCLMDYSLPAAFWRQFHGPVIFNMGPTGLKFSGALGADQVLFLSLLLIGFAAFHIGIAVGVPPKALPGLLPYFLTVVYYCRNRRTSVFVPNDQIVGLDCRGPVVTFRFRKPPVRRLSRIALYIRPDARYDFFEGCRQRWPDLLPEAYRDALRRA